MPAIPILFMEKVAKARPGQCKADAQRQDRPPKQRKIQSMSERGGEAHQEDEPRKGQPQSESKPVPSLEFGKAEASPGQEKEREQRESVKPREVVHEGSIAQGIEYDRGFEAGFQSDPGRSSGRSDQDHGQQA